MVQRVVFGNLGSDYGVKVSRPGVDALVAGDDDLLLSSSERQMQIVTSGIIASTSSGSVYDVTIPNLGFSPFVLFSCLRWDTRLTYLNATTLRFNTYSRKGAGNWLPPSALHYIVLNFPVS